MKSLHVTKMETISEKNEWLLYLYLLKQPKTHTRSAIKYEWRR